MGSASSLPFPSLPAPFPGLKLTVFIDKRSYLGVAFL